MNDDRKVKAGIEFLERFWMLLPKIVFVTISVVAVVVVTTSQLFRTPKVDFINVYYEQGRLNYEIHIDALDSNVDEESLLIVLSSNQEKIEQKGVVGYQSNAFDVTLHRTYNLSVHGDIGLGMQLFKEHKITIEDKPYVHMTYFEQRNDTLEVNFNVLNSATIKDEVITLQVLDNLETVYFEELPYANGVNVVVPNIKPNRTYVLRVLANTHKRDILFEKSIETSDRPLVFLSHQYYENRLNVMAFIEDFFNKVTGDVDLIIKHNDEILFENTFPFERSEVFGEVEINEGIDDVDVYVYANVGFKYTLIHKEKITIPREKASLDLTLENHTLNYTINLLDQSITNFTIQLIEDGNVIEEIITQQLSGSFVLPRGGTYTVLVLSNGETIAAKFIYAPPVVQLNITDEQGRIHVEVQSTSSLDQTIIYADLLLDEQLIDRQFGTSIVFENIQPNTNYVIMVYASMDQEYLLASRTYAILSALGAQIVVEIVDNEIRYDITLDNPNNLEVTSLSVLLKDGLGNTIDEVTLQTSYSGTFVAPNHSYYTLEVYHEYLIASKVVFIPPVGSFSITDNRQDIEIEVFMEPVDALVFIEWYLDGTLLDRVESKKAVIKNATKEATYEIRLVVEADASYTILTESYTFMPALEQEQFRITSAYYHYNHDERNYFLMVEYEQTYAVPPEFILEVESEGVTLATQPIDGYSQAQIALSSYPENITLYVKDTSQYTVDIFHLRQDQLIAILETTPNTTSINYSVSILGPTDTLQTATLRLTPQQTLTPIEHPLSLELKQSGQVDNTTPGYYIVEVLLNGEVVGGVYMYNPPTGRLTPTEDGSAVQANAVIDQTIEELVVVEAQFGTDVRESQLPANFQFPSNQQYTLKLIVKADKDYLIHETTAVVNTFMTGFGYNPDKQAFEITVDELNLQGGQLVTSFELTLTVDGQTIKQTFQPGEHNIEIPHGPFTTAHILIVAVDETRRIVSEKILNN